MDTLTNNFYKRKQSTLFAWLLALIFFVPNLNYYFSFICQSIGFSGLTIPLYIAIYFIVIYAYLKSIFKGWLTLICLAIVAFLYIYTIALWPQNASYMFGRLLDAVYNPLYRIVFLGLPLIFIPCLIEDTSELYNVFCKFAWLNLIIALLAYFWQIIGAGKDFEYMTFSYNMLFSSTICFLNACHKKSTILIAVASVGLLCVIAIGSRGAMLSVALFLFLNFFFFGTRSMTVGRVLFWALLIIGVVFFFLFFQEVLLWFAKFLQSIGFESRSIEKVLDRTFFIDSSRNSISDTIRQSLFKSPFLGHGVFGDRYVIRLARNTYDSSYAHNIILELLCHYGFIFGGFFSITYLYTSLKSLFMKASLSLKTIYICIFSATFFRMMVSSSYLSEQSFYLLIGMIIAIRKFSKGHNEYEVVFHKNIL